MMPDRIYPFYEPAEDVQIAAKISKQPVGAVRKYGKGLVCYFGFRPRDDQSQSLGYETRTLFEILNTLGCYPSSGKFDVNDNPTYVSRTTDYFATSFPNGCTALVNHYRTHVECGNNGFARNAEEDAKTLAENPLPSQIMILKSLKINGHDVTYSGIRRLAFNTDKKGRLNAFNGIGCTSISLDKKVYHLADNPAEITFAPTNGNETHYRVCVTGKINTKIQIPMPARAIKIAVTDGTTSVKGASLKNGNLCLKLTDNINGKWLDVTVKKFSFSTLKKFLNFF